MAKRKQFSFQVTVSVPAWMSKSQAAREVRTLINHQSNFMDRGPNWEDVHEKSVQARKVSSPVVRTPALLAWQQRALDAETLLRDVLVTYETTNPESDLFADSAADTIDMLAQDCTAIERYLDIHKARK